MISIKGYGILRYFGIWDIENYFGILKIPLTDDEFRLLGKGLKFCPKPKPRDVIKLAEENFKFSRRIRLKAFFAPEQEDEETSDSNSETEEIPKVKMEQSSFVPPAGRDSSLDFYIEAITHEILQNTKKYRYHCNLSPGERKALSDLSHDESIIIKKADKSSSVVIMNHADYIKEIE